MRLAPSRFRYNTKTSREPARTSVSSSPTFVPLLATQGLCILLPKPFQRERTCLMKLEIFILLLVNKRPGGVSYVRGVEKSAPRSMVEFELAPVNAFSESQQIGRAHV